MPQNSNLNDKGTTIWALKKVKTIHPIIDDTVKSLAELDIIQLNEKTITVAQGLHWKKDGTWHIAYPKSKRSKRTIDIDDADVAVLKAQKAKQVQAKLLLGDQYHDHGFVCAKPDGSPMKQNTVSNRFKRFAGGLGLPVSFHCLRYTHAKLLIENGMEMRTVSEKLGHYKPSFTWDRYTHFERSKHKQAAKVFHAVLAGCGSGDSKVVPLASSDDL